MAMNKLVPDFNAIQKEMMTDVESYPGIESLSIAADMI